MNFYGSDENAPEASYTLEIGRLGLYTVRCGDRYEEMLCADEALWLMARIIMTDGTVKLRSRDQHKAEHARIFGPASILEPWQKQICDRASTIIQLDEIWSPARHGCGKCCVCGSRPSVARTIRHADSLYHNVFYCEGCSPVVVL